MHLNSFVYKIVNTIPPFNKQNGVAILVYHSISNTHSNYSISLREFEQQIKILSNVTPILSLKEIVDSLKISKQIHGVAVTFDDGYEDNLKTLPLLQHYKIPATFFVLSNPSKVNRIELENSIKLMTPHQMKMLAQDGWNIGSHTETHPNLRDISINQLSQEIHHSKRSLEKIIGKKVQYFAYPKGVCTRDAVQAVKYADYEAAFAVNHSLVTSTTNIFTIPRIIVDKSYESDTLPLRIGSGVQFVRRMVHGNPWRYSS